MTSPGKYRRLSRAATASGHFVILAIDHRLNVMEGLERTQGQPLTGDQFTAFKREVIEALMPAGASALLTDPQFGMAPGFAQGWLPAQAGLLAPLEETDYTIHPSQRTFRAIPGWSPAAIERSGADGVKLLLYYHPEARDAASQREAVERTIEACAAADIPLYLEPITFSPDPARTLSSAELTDVVVASASLFSAMGIDVLKTEFPVDVREQPDEAVWRAALRRLDDACTVPWALLSAGAPYATFVRQTALACEAGSSGVIAGRALWAEAVALPGAERSAFLQTTGRERMAELAAICQASGRDFRARTTPPPPFGPAWKDAP